MSNTRFAIIAMGLSAVVAGGCGESAVTSAPPAAATVAIPATLFASSPPAGAVPLLTAKRDAAPGDRVTFEARVGGRRTVFVEDRAVFFVADSSLDSCDQIPGDTCTYPWDYCCEPSDKLREHVATVRVMSGTAPLKRSLEGEHGLAPLKTVYVSGIAQIDDAGNFVVDADTIYVEEG